MVEVVAPPRPRVNGIQIVNIANENPLAIFNREKLFVIDGETITKIAHPVTKMLLPEMMTQTIEKRNVDTDELTGETFTYADYYQMTYSLSRQVCDEFDAAQLPPIEPPQ